MADLRTTFAGIASPNPFWLASAPPTDKAYNVERAFEAGWGGVVWKTLGEDGPPIVNVNGPRYGALLSPDRQHARLQQHRAHHRPAAADQPRRDRRGQAPLARSRAGRLADGAVHRERVEGDPGAGRGHRRRRRRAQLRLPARHERARHGRGRRPGARVHRDGHGVVQAAQPAAGDRQAHAQRHRHPPAGARRRSAAAPTRSR